MRPFTPGETPSAINQSENPSFGMRSVEVGNLSYVFGGNRGNPGCQPDLHFQTQVVNLG